MQDVNRDQVFEKEDHSAALFNQLEFYRTHRKTPSVHGGELCPSVGI